MTSYPIWIEVNADDYASGKNYGAGKRSNSTSAVINVGASGRNTKPLCFHSTTISDEPDGARLFTHELCLPDGSIICEITVCYDRETKEFSQTSIIVNDDMTKPIQRGDLRNAKKHILL